MKTIVGLFDNWSDAQQVVQDLTNSGIDRDQISMVAGDREGKYASNLERTDTDDDGDATVGGAATGAAVGGIGGVLLGLGALAIPGIGPVIAAGPLVAGLVGAGVGAAVGGLVGALVDAGVPEEEAGYYAEGVRRGSTMVTVGADDADANRVVQIMNRHNPVDIDERVSSWRTSGWTGFDATDETHERGYTSTQASQNVYTDAPDRRGVGTGYATTSASDGEEMKVDVVEEELHVGKRQTGDGGVRVHTHMVTEPVEKQVRLRDEEVHVERRPVDRPATEADLRAFQEQTFDVDAVREEAVVQKEPRVVEEVAIKKDARERTETVRDTVRRTEVDVERMDNDFNTYDTTFRNHYQTNFANRGYGYERYEPAYRYGWNLASDQRYQGRDWNAIESDAQRAWRERNPDSPWEEFKDAVRSGWQEVRRSV